MPDDDHERESVKAHITRPPTSTIIIDDFDILSTKIDETIGPIRRELNTSTLLVVVVSSSWERALELRAYNHGLCKLIEPAGIGRWTADQLESLFLTHNAAVSIQDMYVWDRKERNFCVCRRSLELQAS